MSPSPRSSVEATHSPSSPFLYNLQQRLRKGSNGSRASSHSSDAALSNCDALNLPQDTKSTKRYLLSIVRDDWDYPTNQVVRDSTKLQRESYGYRLRDESVSEYESNGHRSSRSQDDDAYKFDNPDDVGIVIARRRARKRQLLEQEMTYNEGLRLWTLRRDAWVGAIPHKPGSAMQDYGSSRQRRLSKQSRIMISSDSTHRSSNSAPAWPLPAPTENGVEPSTVESLQAVSEADPDQGLPDGPYLPIYPPLLPASHALRSRIKPSAYPTLYSKVVVQGLAPNVPIPLTDMIGALVDGWKAEGNWPPQSTESQPGIVKTKTRKSETSFQKWKREQDKMKSAAAQGVEWVQEPEHKSVRKSIIGGVKKAFGKKDTGRGDAEQDLTKIGLTFEEQEDHIDEPDAALGNTNV